MAVRCHSRRAFPTKRSHRRLDVAETAPIGWPGTLSKGGHKVRMALDISAVCDAGRLSENSPSCKLTPTSAVWVVVTRRSHASRRTAAAAPGSLALAATAAAVRALATDASSPGWQPAGRRSPLLGEHLVDLAQHVIGLRRPPPPPPSPA